MVSSTRTVTTSPVEVTASEGSPKASRNVVFRGQKKADSSEEPEVPYKREIVWANVAKFVFIHSLALNGLYCLLTGMATWQTLVFSFYSYCWAGISVTAGAHRLWTHRSYKAKAPLRAFLMVLNCMAAENSLYIWCRDHRVHHKYSETSADPHDSNRGFFFAHMGWLLVRKHPEVSRKGSKIDMSDLKADPIVMFQHNHYIPLMVLFCYIVPTAIPMYFWGESFWTAYVMAVFRQVAVLHATWLVNSAAHMWGNKPYDTHINPAENKFVSFFAGGEGFHNYHHTFPHDYSTSEWRWSFNGTTVFIDAMAFIGQVSGRKSVAKETVLARIQRTGPQTKGMIVEAEPLDY